MRAFIIQQLGFFSRKLINLGYSCPFYSSPIQDVDAYDVPEEYTWHLLLNKSIALTLALIETELLFLRIIASIMMLFV